ncbi:MAG: TetR/AcrR family transcriptional regulator [Actinobacteria bacterium]|nr:MAG: TetR/AcrR family transcriptional regulator [Actinomycetota bacterium]TML47600.1 MAG: TetR/AcrR family transcriptional regulator [Actinomycetota bacterium]TML70935.1 MAG: TetR/AcrR family transcriptional regulator [Actinomycetota bacterium]
MNLTSLERYSSGIQSPVSTWPPSCTYSRNSWVRVSTTPPYRTVVSIQYMATRRDDLTRAAARLFAERGFHGTSMGDLAEALGVQKGSLYSHTGSKQQLLFETMRAGADAFHAALDAVPEDASAVERIRLALRGHLRVVVEQLDVATVFTREWRYLDDTYRAEIVAERRRYEERFRALFREGVEAGELRPDLDAATAALLVLSAANWAYTWLTPERETDELADRFTAILVDGIRGYATPA